MTTLLQNTDEQLVELLTEHIRNWKLLLEDAIQTEDEAVIEQIQERIREDRQQLNALRS
jgi:hypothetical protein